MLEGASFGTGRDRCSWEKRGHRDRVRLRSVNHYLGIVSHND